MRLRRRQQRQRRRQLLALASASAAASLSLLCSAILSSPLRRDATHSRMHNQQLKCKCLCVYVCVCLLAMPLPLPLPLPLLLRCLRSQCVIAAFLLSFDCALLLWFVFCCCYFFLSPILVFCYFCFCQFPFRNATANCFCCCYYLRFVAASNSISLNSLLVLSLALASIGF